MANRHIAVEGPPSVGKTSLARRLAEKLKARLVLRDENPFAQQALEDPTRAGFQSQIFAALSQYSQRDQLVQQDLFAQGGVISDHLFIASRILAQLFLSRDELHLFDQVYSLLKPKMPRPDLVVYLHARADVLSERLRR